MIHTLAGTLTFKKISNLIEKKKPSIAWDREASIAFVLKKQCLLLLPLVFDLYFVDLYAEPCAYLWAFTSKNRIQFLFYIVIIYLYTCRYLVLFLSVTDMTHVIACIRTRFCRRKSIPCIIPWWCPYKTFVYPCIFSCFKKSDTKHEAREK